MINIKKLEASVGLNTNTMYMQARRDPRIEVVNGEVSQQDAATLLRGYLSKSRYADCHKAIQSELDKLNGNYINYKEVKPKTKDVTQPGNAVVGFLEGPIWKGILAAIAVGVSSVYLFQFIDAATQANSISIPAPAKWAEAIVVSFIGVTMAVSNREKKIVLRPGFKSTSGNMDRPEVAIHIANIWLFVFFSLELLAMFSLWGIIQSDTAKLAILALFVPVSTLSFAHLFLKQ